MVTPIEREWSTEFHDFITTVAEKPVVRWTFGAVLAVTGVVMVARACGYDGDYPQPPPVTTSKEPNEMTP